MIKEAYKHLTEGNFEDAVDAFSNCLLLEPAEARAYYGRGVARLRLKQWPLAILDFKKAQELNPEDTENQIELALSLAIDNQIYEAIAVYEALLARQPHFVRVHIQLAMLYYRLGIIYKGHRQLDVALSSRPSLDQRRMIEQMRKEQTILDKKRYHRPDFEELRKKRPGGSASLLKMFKNQFRKKDKQ